MPGQHHHHGPKKPVAATKADVTAAVKSIGNLLRRVEQRLTDRLVRIEELVTAPPKPPKVATYLVLHAGTPTQEP